MASIGTSRLAIIFLSLVFIPCYLEANKKKTDLIIKVEDFKDFKKLLKTKTNLLVIYAQSDKAVSQSLSIFQNVANEIRGKGTLAFINCGEEKKLCKKLKVSPTTFDIKHYKDGEFNKDYDRKISLKSMLNFLLDPTGDLPWEEDPTAQDVVHIDTEGGLAKQLKKNKSPHLVMFYAPWCGYCKRLKPDYSAAATEMKGKAILVGIDVDKPQLMSLRTQYNITGFPTIYYFENGKLKYPFGGENNKDGIVSWLKNPGPPKEPEKEAEWSDEESDVVHLTDENFQETLDKESSAVVMFYAPWCGHCKQMKPGYTEAAATLKTENIPGILAAVDATKHRKVAEEFKVKGFPSVKYFVNGKYEYDFNERSKEKIIEFMKDPKEPPPPPPPEPKWEETESDVIHLTEDNFKPTLKKKKHALVMFYAPWCGHCKKAKPEYMEAASKLKKDNKVALTAVDCTTQSGVCSAHDVSGYPTFKYFNYGKNPQVYMGGRVEADFISFMKDPLNPNPGSPPAEKASDPKDDWKEITGYENIHYLNSANFDTFLKDHKSVLVMFYAPWCGHCKNMKPAYAEAATILKDENEEGVLAAVDATIDKDIAEKHKVTGFPTLKYFKNGEYAFEGSSRSKEGLVKFMKNPQAPPPPPPPEPKWDTVKSAVTHLTDKTFNDYMKNNKNVLVMFYAPWCGHCKRAKPEYQSAADSILPTSENKMAAVDCTEHKEICGKEDVKGYPTIKFYQNGEFSKLFSGSRDKAGFLDFFNQEQKAADSKEEKKDSKKKDSKDKDSKKKEDKDSKKKDSKKEKDSKKDKKKSKKEKEEL